MSNLFCLEPEPSNGDVLALKAFGQLEAMGAKLLLEECRALVKCDAKQIIIDLAAVTVISSSGIGSLLLVQEDIETAGKSIAFTNLSKEVMSVVRLMDLESLLNLNVSTNESPA